MPVSMVESIMVATTVARICCGSAPDIVDATAAATPAKTTMGASWGIAMAKEMELVRVTTMPKIRPPKSKIPIPADKNWSRSPEKISAANDTCVKITKIPITSPAESPDMIARGSRDGRLIACLVFISSSLTLAPLLPKS